MKTSFGRTLLSGVLLGLLAVPSLAQVSGWGTSDSLQLLNSNTTNATPLSLGSLGSPTALATGAASGYALYSNGNVSAWGNNSGNQLARPNNGPELPATVLGLPPIAKIYAGGFNAYAMASDGSLYGWGFNGYGELGLGAPGAVTSPALIGNFGANAKMFIGDSRALILKEDGSLLGAGYNYTRDLAQGDRSDRYTFVPIPGISNVRSAAFGGVRAALASTADGKVYSWGNSEYVDTTNEPTLEPGLSNIVRVAATGGASFAIDATGTVLSWGNSANGRLGRPFTGNELTPTAIPGLPAIADVQSSKDGTVYALGQNGSVWAWGYGSFGALGNGSSNDQYVPVQVMGLASVSAISSGRGFILALSVPAQSAPVALSNFALLETTTQGYRNVRARVTLDQPAGPGGVQVSLASRAVGSLLPHGLPTQSYNGLTLTDLPSPRPNLRKLWRIRNRTNSTHNYQMIVVGMPDVIRGSVPPGTDAYFVSKTLPGCLNITLLVDDTNHVSLDIAGNAAGSVPTNVFANVGIPATVTVPAGETSYEFDIFAKEVPLDSTVEIVASYGSVTKVAALKILLESARPTP